MKTIYYKFYKKFSFLLLCICCLVACSDDESLLETDANPLKMEVSSNHIILDLDNPDKEILYFTWNPAEDRTAAGSKLVGYLFKLDLANNSFETSVPTSAITEGIFYKGFTTRELNDLLVSQWGVSLGTEVGLEARIIAKYENEDKFIMPIVSTISFRIQSKAPEGRPLYVIGSATSAGNDLEKAIEMNEILKGETYTWRGKLNVGEYYFLPQRTSEFPAYMQDESAEMDKVIYQESASDNGKPFVIEKSAYYAISVNLTTQRISCEEVFFIEDLSVIGSGTDYGWPAGSASATDAAYGGKMQWSQTNPHECEITTVLKKGELRICIAGQSDAAFRPYNASAPVSQQDHDVVFMKKPDYKWSIESSDAGTYKIVLDTKNYKISFIKQ